MTTAKVSADLSVLEFAYLVNRSESIVLPQRLVLPWQPELLPAADREQLEREIVDSLTAKGFLADISADDALAADDLSDFVPRAWKSFLAVFALSPLTITCNSWAEGHSTTVNIALAVGYAVALHSGATVTSDPAGNVPDPTLRLTAMEIDSVASTMLDLFPGTADDDRSSPSSTGITLPLAEAQAGILALREGRPEVISALIAQWNEPHFPRVFGGLAVDSTGGFEITVHTTEGENVFTASWVRGDRGWLNVRLTPPADGSRTAEAFTESATITVTPASHATVTAEVLGLMTSIATGGTRGDTA
jgi:hypothetical protein